MRTIFLCFKKRNFISPKVLKLNCSLFYKPIWLNCLKTLCPKVLGLKYLLFYKSIFKKPVFYKSLWFSHIRLIFFIAFFITFFIDKAYSLESDVIKLPEKRPTLTGEKTGVAISKAKIEDITSKNYPGLIDSFEFNAPLRDVIKTMSKFLNMNIILGQGIGTERIEIISHSPITVAEAYKAFLSALAIQNLTIIKSGSFLKVIKKENAIRSNLRVYRGHKSIKADQFITRIIKLKHIDAESLQEKMKPFIDDKAVSSLIFYPPSNTVIISGYGSNVEKVRTIITGIDTPSEDFTLRVFRLRIAEAKTIATIIKEIIKNLTPTGRRAFSRYSIKSKSTGISQLLNIQSVSQDERTNSIIAMGHPTALEKLGALIKTLDSDENTKMSAQIHVYKVKYAKAEDLATTLQSIFQNTSSANNKEATNLKAGGGSKPKSANQANIALAQAFKDVRIIPEEKTNSLLIVSNTANYELVKTILDEVDISKNQVFVKAIIMELVADKNNEWKMANYFFPEEGGGIARMGYGLSNLSDVFNTSGGATLFFPLSLFFKGKLFGTSTDSKTDIAPLIGNSFIGSSASPSSLPEKINVPSLSSFVKFLQQTVGANVLSTPQIMALDHKKASVSIVDKIPVQGEQTVGGGVVGQITTGTRDVDIETLLEITPRISPNVDSIRLDIKQKIDSIAPSASVPEELQKTNVATKKRQIETSIILKDKETAVLGGMVKEESTKTNSKIPILGDLPLIGWLFKSSTTERKKSNIIVFITPHIVRSAEEHQNILSSKLRERMKFIRQFTGSEDPYAEVIKDMLQKSEPIIPEKDSPLPEFEEPAEFEEPTEETDYYGDDEDAYYIEEEEADGDDNDGDSNDGDGYTKERADNKIGEENKKTENTNWENRDEENNMTSSLKDIEQNTEEAGTNNEDTVQELEESGAENTDTIDLGIFPSKGFREETEDFE